MVFLGASSSALATVDLGAAGAGLHTGVGRAGDATAALGDAVATVTGANEAPAGPRGAAAAATIGVEVGWGGAATGGAFGGSDVATGGSAGGVVATGATGDVFAAGIDAGFALARGASGAAMAPTALATRDGSTNAALAAAMSLLRVSAAAPPPTRRPHVSSATVQESVERPPLARVFTVAGSFDCCIMKCGGSDAGTATPWTLTDAVETGTMLGRPAIPNGAGTRLLRGAEWFGGA